MIEIPLRNRAGEVIANAVIDDEDYAQLTMKLRGSGPARWSRDQDGYAVRSTWRDGKKVLFRMHRVIMGVNDPAVEVDHRDGDRLNNRRSNLRKATRAQNAQNINAGRLASSGYRNVHWHARRRKWAVQLKSGGDRGRTYGYFERLEDAVVRAAEVRAEVHPFATAR